ncbi:hypothetical protein B296_00039039 [Ensete ventricosum]|uniref:Uncharacterized protein n=1 Tax=Ensete ventricosum TaxID=4639 RepID=A0A426ZUN9_ENSVE|nr:hypothetical protein B296_00039039 [Ensete ventricosum]
MERLKPPLRAIDDLTPVNNFDSTFCNLTLVDDSSAPVARPARLRPRRPYLTLISDFNSTCADRALGDLTLVGDFASIHRVTRADAPLATRHWQPPITSLICKQRTCDLCHRKPSLFVLVFLKELITFYIS